jgi:hypothetical protein
MLGERLHCRDADLVFWAVGAYRSSNPAHHSTGVV